MRCYQHFGLTPEAEAYLEKNVVLVPSRICPKCGEIITWERKVLSVKGEDVFYGSGPILHTYEGKDGKKIKEIVQALPWSSGPCGFICLELEDGTRIEEWSQEEIDKV